jgi:ribosomal protein S14
MLFLKIKDLKKRILFLKFENIKQIKKFVLINLLSKFHFKFKNHHYLFLILLNLNLKYISKIKFTQRCILTNRSRRVIRFCNLSHSVFRRLIQFGMVPGFKKAIW